QAIFRRGMFKWEVAAKVFTAFGIMAAMLAAIGVYGLVSFLVMQRHREMGIRAALGAGRKRLMRLVLWDSLKISTIGLAIGLAAALVTARLVATQLYGLTWTHLSTYLAVAAGLTAITILASLRPAARASGA